MFTKVELGRGVSLTALCSYRLEMGLYLAWRHCPQELASSLSVIRKAGSPGLMNQVRGSARRCGNLV